VIVIIIAEQLVAWIYRSLADDPDTRSLDGNSKMFPEEI